jgi:hypothetical protein
MLGLERFEILRWLIVIHRLRVLSKVECHRILNALATTCGPCSPSGAKGQDKRAVS